MEKRAIYLYLAACLITPVLVYGQAEVSYGGGLLTVRCNELPLVQVFEQIKAHTGMELILEDSIKTNRLTANIEAKPVHMALERLLEGSGVNYAISFDPQDWTRVTAIFVGGGGEGPSSPAPQASTSRSPARRGSARSAEPADDFNEPDPDEIVDEEDFGAEEYSEEEGPDAGIEPTDDFEEPPESEFSPPPPSYPRSPFTPGLESSPFGSNNRQQAQPVVEEPQQEGDPDAPPPAYYPFLDREGRPIPVPPGTVPRQPQKKKNP